MLTLKTTPWFIVYLRNHTYMHYNQMIMLVWGWLSFCNIGLQSWLPGNTSCPAKMITTWSHVITWIRFPHYRLFARKIHQLLVVEPNVELTCHQSVGQHNSFIILNLSSWFVLLKINGKTQQHLDVIVPERNCVQNFIAHCIMFDVRWYCLSNPTIYAPIQKSLVHL